MGNTGQDAVGHGIQVTEGGGGGRFWCRMWRGGGAWWRSAVGNSACRPLNNGRAKAL